MNINKHQILVKVLFFKEGRNTPPNFTERMYRPHFVVKGTKELLGICFIEGNTVQLGSKSNAIIETVYDGVDYSTLLNPNTEFDIVEGRNVVGEGHVIEALDMTDIMFREKCDYASNLMDSNLIYEEYCLLCGIIVELYRYSEFGDNKNISEFRHFSYNFSRFVENREKRGKLKDVYFSRHYDKDNRNYKLTEFLK